MRAYSPATNEQVYLTSEVMIACDVTQRELQWWDEHKIVMPAMVGHHREYSEWEAIEVALVKHMRTRGISLATVRKALAQWRRDRRDRKRFILIGKNGSTQLAHTPDAVVRIISSADATWVIDAGEKMMATRAILARIGSGSNQLSGRMCTSRPQDFHAADR